MKIVIAIFGTIGALFVLTVVLGTIVRLASPAPTQTGTQLSDASSVAEPTVFDPSRSSCTPRDFKISGLDGRTEDGDYAIITGTITNNCAEAAGVQIQYALYDDTGKVVTTEQLWPASVSNIAPNDQYPFKITTSVDRDWVRYTVRAIDTRKW